MRLLRSTVLLVVCAAGCQAPTTEGDDVVASPHRSPSASTEPSGTDGGRPPLNPEPTTPVPTVINEAVATRARAALKEAGAAELVRTPGYEGQVNVAFTGVWQERPFLAYAVPTPDSGDGELTVISRSDVDGHTVEVMRIEDGSVRLLRFIRGPDTWLVASLTPNLAESDGRLSLVLASELLR